MPTVALELVRCEYSELAPFEFSWSNFYLQSKNIPIFPTDPYFKMIHNKSQLLQSQIIGIEKADYARSYVGIVVNSNFRSALDQILLDENPDLLLSKKFKFISVYRIFHYKLRFIVNRKFKVAKHSIKYMVLPIFGDKSYFHRKD